jgi:hypothetical protein
MLGGEKARGLESLIASRLPGLLALGGIRFRGERYIPCVGLSKK